MGRWVLMAPIQVFDQLSVGRQPCHGGSVKKGNEAHPAGGTSGFGTTGSLSGLWKTLEPAIPSPAGPEVEGWEFPVRKQLFLRKG